MADNPLIERDDDPLGGSLHLRSDGSIEAATTAPGSTTEINGTEASPASDAARGHDRHRVRLGSSRRGALRRR